jgi:general secretion pathway protein H
MTRFRTRRRTAGFTLVELMVVLVIIGLAASAVVLMLPDTGTSLGREADRFAARARFARDRAITDNRATMVALDGTGYRVAARLDDSWETLGEHAWEEGTIVAAVGETANLTRFDSTGLAAPLRVTLTRDGREVAIDIAANGDIRVQR